MQHGFYVVQYESNAIKVEAISFVDTSQIYKNIIRSVFITGSISSFLKNNRDTSDSDILATRLLNCMDLSMFTNEEYTHISILLITLINDYLG